MNLLDYLDKLRDKPEAHRLRIALTTAAVITGVIFFVWLTTLPVRFSEPEHTAGMQEKDVSPFATLLEQLETATKSAYQQFEQLRENLGSIEYKADEDSEEVPE